VPVLIAGAIIFYYMRGGAAQAKYITGAASRGSVVRSVIATGTVNPVTTVQVGSYDSGPITAIYADFNASVKAGERVAKIDPHPYQVKVDESAAALANARAQLGKDQADTAYKKITLQRNQRLLAAQAVSQDTVDSALSAYLQDVAQLALDRANIQQQQANLHDAQVNLDYTDIVSPVDGTIVSRNVDVGQTVAASFQTPTLFLIAKDLTKMQVDANVSESDIGAISAGQPGGFTVDAFPDREFAGVVGQVRQAPITVQNVVTYDVVVNVANPEMLLKPGMTANVTIVTARRDDVLRVPLAAIRFAPRSRRAREMAAADPPAPGAVSNQAQVWIEHDGKLASVTVKTGLDDGVNVEILSGDLKAGDQVVVEEARAASAGAAAGGPLSQRHF